MKKTYLLFFVSTLLFGQRPVDLVNPLVDSANSRWFFFSSATRPFGMVNLSPDMGTAGAWESGYRYNQKTINFFSHIHAWQLSGVPVLPTTGAIKAHLGPNAYGSAYSHERETVEPGYHAVVLDDYNIKAELTSTVRVGFHRYTFPESDQSAVIIDLSTQLGPSGTDRGWVKKISNKKLQGEKGSFGKQTLWSESTHVPLIFKIPDGKQNIRIDQPVELLDLYPTLLKLSGLPENPQNEGKSLVPLFEEEINPAAVAITTYGKNNHSLVNQKYRYIRYEDGMEELYDIQNDPQERNNLSHLIALDSVKTQLRDHLPKVNADWKKGSSYNINEYFIKTSQPPSN